MDTPNKTAHLSKNTPRKFSFICTVWKLRYRCAIVSKPSAESSNYQSHIFVCFWWQEIL